MAAACADPLGTFLRLAEAETYRPLWSADVLTELRRNLIVEGLDADKVDYRIGQMRHAFPSAMVTGYGDAGDEGREVESGESTGDGGAEKWI